MNNEENFGKKSQYLKNKEYQKYFYMKRNELEKIFNNKIDIDEINTIYERLGKDKNINNNIIIQ